ncbi:uncharacterized protein I206_103851 [Kwoniella pini CBS 10737]|uniref:Uncharacterized protein n=1 Tax=Kwoniella pini CBS 10737 TaxID=1296096 RepID=A0A1B9HSS5_9TREE|nr:uncharacterized protein I206_07804 [Kwoniella pini CBS 10737]OCF46322.1 hypothetical protein I206_07804 [Kwoniella pini CBS 10737]
MSYITCDTLKVDPNSSWEHQQSIFRLKDNLRQNSSERSDDLPGNVISCTWISRAGGGSKTLHRISFGTLDDSIDESEYDDGLREVTLGTARYIASNVSYLVKQLQKWNEDENESCNNFEAAKTWEEATFGRYAEEAGLRDSVGLRACSKEKLKTALGIETTDPKWHEMNKISDKMTRVTDPYPKSTVYYKTRVVPNNNRDPLTERLSTFLHAPYIKPTYSGIKAEVLQAIWVTRNGESSKTLHSAIVTAKQDLSDSQENDRLVGNMKNAIDEYDQNFFKGVKQLIRKYEETDADMLPIVAKSDQAWSQVNKNFTEGIHHVHTSKTEFKNLVGIELTENLHEHDGNWTSSSAGHTVSKCT